MSDPKNDPSTTDKAPEKEEKDDKVVILILAKKPTDYKSAQAFLKRRGWEIHLSDNIKDGMAIISSKKVSWVLISANLPNTSFDRIPGFLIQTFNVRCIGFAEDNAPSTKLKLVSSNIPQIQGKPSGPSIQTKIRNILASESSAAERDAQKKGGGWKEETDDNIRISSKGGAGANSTVLKGSSSDGNQQLVNEGEGFGEDGNPMGGGLGLPKDAHRSSGKFGPNGVDDDGYAENSFANRMGRDSDNRLRGSGLEDEDDFGQSGRRSTSLDESNEFGSGKFNDEDKENEFGRSKSLSAEEELEGRRKLGASGKEEDDSASGQNAKSEDSESRMGGRNSDEENDDLMKRSNASNAGDDSNDVEGRQKSSKPEVQVQKGQRGTAFSETEEGAGAGDSLSATEDGMGMGDAMSEVQKGNNGLKTYHPSHEQEGSENDDRPDGMSGEDEKARKEREAKLHSADQENSQEDGQSTAVNKDDKSSKNTLEQEAAAPFGGKKPEELQQEEFFHYCARKALKKIYPESGFCELPNLTASKIGVIAVHAPNLSGYLCLILSAEVELTEDLLRSYRDTLQDCLMERSFILEKAWNAVIHWPLPNIKSWLNNRSQFSAAVTDGNALRTISFLKEGSTLPVVRFTAQDTERVVIAHEEIRAESDLPCDFFIFLTPEKKIRYLKKDGQMTTEQRDRWNKKKKTDIFIRRDDIYAYEIGFVTLRLFKPAG